MNVIRATIYFSGMLLILSTGNVVAQQDDKGFEELLNDITQPPAATGAPGTTLSAPESAPAAEPEASTSSEAAVEEAAPVAEETTAETVDPGAAAVDPLAGEVDPGAAEVDPYAATEQPAAAPVEESTSAVPVEEMSPAASETPSASEEPTVIAEPAVESQPNEIGAPAEESQPAEIAAPAEESQPAEIAAPAEENLPVEEVAPVEETIATEVEAPIQEEATETVVQEEAAPLDMSMEPEQTPSEEPAPAAEQTYEQPSIEEAPAAAEVVEGTTEEEPAAEAEPEIVDAKAARLAAKQEEVRRQAREVQGRKSLESGLAALTAGHLDQAIKDLEDAKTNIPERPATVDAREQVRVALGQAYYLKAQDILRKKGNLEDAHNDADLAQKITPENKRVTELLKDIEAEQKRQAVIAAKPVPPQKRPEYVAKKKTIDELLTEGRQLFKLGDYNAAEVAYEKVLLQDEYNIEAMRYLRKIEELRYAAKSREREATVADMIQTVRDTWNPPIRDDVNLPEVLADRSHVEGMTTAQKLQEKMEKIIIPSIEFRQANINDVVNFLVDASVAGDPSGAGVNIILNLSLPGEAAAPAPTPEPVTTPDAFGGGGLDEFGGTAGGGAFSAPSTPSASVPTITLNLRRISLLDAIKYITEVAGLKFRVEENAVMITPAGVVSGRVVTRLYPVQPSILDVIVEKEETPERTGEFVEMGSTRATIKKSDVKEFFVRAGVPFPVGTSITYNQSISQLIVANTPENLENFERILSRLNVTPNQVEIEARFVEIGQDDLEELGLQWILTDNWELATKEGTTAASTEKVQINADSQGLTKGLRFFNFNTSSGTINPLAATIPGTANVPLGSVLTFASVLTNPELTVIVQALSQHGNSDLLSAPRVTTRSGVNAQIQVVQEIIYPTEFETTQPQFSSSSGDTQIVTPPLVTPGSFKTRETGVILNVTPTVGPDGYTIDLTLVPEVSELLDWIQYGSTFGTFTFNIPQPIFASRNVTTSIVIWDGQTVVMGGLIREVTKKIKDKIPILGDIPILGRLFRTEGEFSSKKNLLIFVSARLVDPSGKPIHRGESVGVAQGDQPAAPTATP